MSNIYKLNHSTAAFFSRETAIVGVFFLISLFFYVNIFGIYVTPLYGLVLLWYFVIPVFLNPWAICLIFFFESIVLGIALGTDSLIILTQILILQSFHKFLIDQSFLMKWIIFSSFVLFTLLLTAIFLDILLDVYVLDMFYIFLKTVMYGILFPFYYGILVLIRQLYTTEKR